MRLFPTPASGGYDLRHNQGLLDWSWNYPVEHKARPMQYQQSPAVAQDPRVAAIEADRQEASFRRAEAQFGTDHGVPVALGLFVLPRLA